MKSLHGISFILLVIGGLNWGLIALGNYMGSNWNVVNRLLGSWPAVENLIYLLVGIGALLILFSHKKMCRACGSSSSMGGGQQM